MEITLRISEHLDRDTDNAYGILMENMKELKHQIKLFHQTNQMKTEETYHIGIWDLYILWEHYHIEKYNLLFGGNYLAIENSFSDLFKLPSIRDIFMSFNPFLQTKVEWNVFYTSSALYHISGKTMHYRTIFRKVISLSLGYFHTSHDFTLVSMGPHIGMAIFIYTVSDSVYLVISTEINRFYEAEKDRPIRYKFNQIIKVIDLVPTLQSAHKVIQNYKEFISHDRDRFVQNHMVSDLKLRENQFCKQKGFLFVPFFFRNVVISEEESRELVYDISTQRWVLKSIYYDTSGQMNSLSLHESMVNQINSAILQNLITPENCRFFVEFLWKQGLFNHRLTDQEIQLIGSPGNIMTIGRSGTGKTTCTILRLFALEFQYRMNKKKEQGFLVSRTGEIGDKKDKTDLHCIFLSVSPVLVREVKSYYNKLIESARKRQNAEDETIIVDKELEWQESDDENIPEYLEENKFPLFLSMKKFLSLVDYQLQAPFFFYGMPNSKIVNVNYYAKKKYRYVYREFTSSRKPVLCFEVDFEYFNLHFWPRHCMRTSLSSLAVWTEILTLIKGTLSVDYKNLGKKQSILNEEERQQVLDIYKHYETWKKSVNGYDIQDLVNHIVGQIDKNGYHGFPVHFAMVDEVQDCSINMMALLCRLSEYNLFFSGDTAQTIAKGIGFRFSDVRTLFVNGKLPHSPPQIHHLTVNFRSHGRILDLANSIVSLIKAFFPSSIDALADETSPDDGPKPIILDSEDFSSIGLLLLGSSVSRSRINFGCNQVILVRSDESKKNLPQELRHAVCLTIYESKGLEFEDVIIYNFFADSKLSRRDWDNFGMLYIDDDGKLKCNKTFNQTKYALLNTEFKHLYVAITRAKKRIIFFDSDPENKAMMQKYWAERNLVDVAAVSANEEGFTVDGGAFEVRNSPEEWRSQGLKLLKFKFYEQALKCFRYARDGELEQKAYAYFTAETASKMFSEIQAVKEEAKARKTKIHKPQKRALQDKFQEAKRLFVEAGNAFASLGMMLSAGQCYFSAEDFPMAIRVFEDNEYWEETGEVLFKLKEFERASHLFLRAENIERTIGCMIELKDIDAALNVLKNNYAKVHDINRNDLLTSLVKRKIRRIMAKKENENIDAREEEKELDMIGKSDPVSSVEDKPNPVSLIEDKSDSVSLIEDKTDPVSLVEDESNSVLLIEDKTDPASLIEDKSDPFSLIEDESNSVLLIEDKPDPVSLIEDKTDPVSLIEDDSEPVSLIEEESDSFSFLDDKSSVNTFTIIDDTSSQFTFAEESCSEFSLPEYPAQEEKICEIRDLFYSFKGEIEDVIEPNVNWENFRDELNEYQLDAISLDGIETDMLGLMLLTAEYLKMEKFLKYLANRYRLYNKIKFI